MKCATRRAIKLVQQYIHGLHSSFRGLSDILNRHAKIDIVTLSETHLSESEDQHLYTIPGF